MYATSSFVSNEVFFNHKKSFDGPVAYTNFSLFVSLVKLARKKIGVTLNHGQGYFESN